MMDKNYQSKLKKKKGEIIKEPNIKSKNEDE